MRQVSGVQLTADLVFEPKHLVVKLLFPLFFNTRNGEESEVPRPIPRNTRANYFFYFPLDIVKF